MIIKGHGGLGIRSRLICGLKLSSILKCPRGGRAGASPEGEHRCEGFSSKRIGAMRKALLLPRVLKTARRRYMSEADWKGANLQSLLSEFDSHLAFGFLHLYKHLRYIEKRIIEVILQFGFLC